MKLEFFPFWLPPPPTLPQLNIFLQNRRLECHNHIVLEATRQGPNASNRVSKANTLKWLAMAYCGGGLQHFPWPAVIVAFVFFGKDWHRLWNGHRWSGLDKKLRHVLFSFFATCCLFFLHSFEQIFDWASFQGDDRHNSVAIQVEIFSRQMCLLASRNSWMMDNCNQLNIAHSPPYPLS